METHILNGDALAEKFPIAGEVIVCREALIDGPVDATGEAFWRERARYLANTYHAEETTYFVEVKSEFEKLSELNTDGINLWFEHDLFCQVNLWFTLYYIDNTGIDKPLFLVMPPPQSPDVWSGFGRMKGADLQLCFQQRIQMSKPDFQVGIDLWNAFSKNDFATLKKLSAINSSCYPYLKDVIEAHLDRFPSHKGRPQKRLREIQKSGVTDFYDIFKEFSKTEGIYGFGDLQVKKLLVSL